MTQNTLDIDGGEKELVSKVRQTTTFAQRLISIDMLRGIAMILMALDHASVNADVDITAESYGSVVPKLPPLPNVLIGLLTNIASGIFFTLSGVSVAFFESSRRKRGWTEIQINRFLITRAAILLLLDIFVNQYVWSQNLFTFDVLSAVAFGLIVLSFVRLLSLRWIAIGAVLLFFGYPFLVQYLQIGSEQPLINLLAEFIQYHHGSPPYIEFPALGRLSLVFGGYVIGRLLVERKLTIKPQLIWVALIGIGVTFILRLIDQYGNFLPYRPNEPFIYFFIENKEPPSIVFLLFNLSLGIAILALLAQFQAQLEKGLIGRILLIFGQTSLFFYLAHQLLYRYIIYQIVLRTIRHLPFSFTDLEQYIMIWSLGILALIPLCFAYRYLRQKYPNSVLQYL